jgi:hypothetical protein
MDNPWTQATLDTRQRMSKINNPQKLATRRKKPKQPV